MEETPRPPVGYPSHESRGGARAHCDDDAHNSPPRHTPGVTPGESNIPQFVPRGPRYPSRRQPGARRAPISFTNVQAKSGCTLSPLDRGDPARTDRTTAPFSSPRWIQHHAK